MDTSPKTDNNGGVMVTKTTPTSANGKKLVQARLPFKTLMGSSTVETTTAASTTVTIAEKRKRKLSKTETADDLERAPKLNRIDGNLVVNDLLSTEILDESVEYTITDQKSMGKSEVKPLKSESKENVNNNERNQDDEDDDVVLELDESSGGTLSDDIDLTESKAKKCLDMNLDTKRAKRTNDENLIIIKLPMAKKGKETTKKLKKGKKKIASVLKCSIQLIIIFSVRRKDQNR